MRFKHIGSLIMIMLGVVGAIASAAQGHWEGMIPYTLLAYVANMNAQQTSHIDWVNDTFNSLHEKTNKGFKKVRQDMNSVKRELDKVGNHE